MWDVATGRQLHVFRGDAGFIAVSPNGRFLLSGARGKTVALWNVEELSKVHTFSNLDDGVLAVGFSADGKRAIACVGLTTVIVWDVNTFQEKSRSTVRSGAYQTRPVISPDGRLIAYVTSSEFLYLWDVARKVEDGRLGKHALIYSQAFSADGKFILTGGLDKSLKLWEVETRREVYSLGNLDFSPTTLALSSDGRYGLAASGGFWGSGRFHSENDSEIRLYRFPIENLKPDAPAGRAWRTSRDTRPRPSCLRACHLPRD